jgi:hypothetical protein
MAIDRARVGKRQYLHLENGPVGGLGAFKLQARLEQQARAVHHPVVGVLLHSPDIGEHLLGGETVSRVVVLDVQAQRKQDALVEHIQVLVLVLRVGSNSC